MRNTMRVPFSLLKNFQFKIEYYSYDLFKEKIKKLLTFKMWQ